MCGFKHKGSVKAVKGNENYSVVGIFTDEYLFVIS